MKKAIVFIAIASAAVIGFYIHNHLHESHAAISMPYKSTIVFQPDDGQPGSFNGWYWESDDTPNGNHRTHICAQIYQTDDGRWYALMPNLERETVVDTQAEANKWVNQFCTGTIGSPVAASNTPVAAVASGVNSVANTGSIGTIVQTSTGAMSPNIAGVGGNVTINARGDAKTTGNNSPATSGSDNVVVYQSSDSTCSNIVAGGTISVTCDDQKKHVATHKSITYVHPDASGNCVVSGVQGVSNSIIGVGDSFEINGDMFICKQEQK